MISSNICYNTGYDTEILNKSCVKEGKIDYENWYGI